MQLLFAAESHFTIALWMPVCQAIQDYHDIFDWALSAQDKMRRGVN
jgi:hypothetical protein